MKKRIRLFFMMLGLVLVATACTSAVAPSAGIGQAERRPENIRVGFSTAADMGDIASLIALELLAERGYKVEPVFYSGAELSVAALAKGDVQFGNGSTRTHWTAIAKSAEIVTIMEQAANAWSIVSTPETVACADLQGKRLAITSMGSLNGALLNAYIRINCPGTAPNIVLIANSESRAAALMTGAIDAAPLETSDLMRIERLAPGRFRRLVDFATSLPRLKTTGIYVNRAFATQHAEVVKEYLEAVLTVHRRIRNEPALVEAAVVKYLGMEKAEAAELAQFYMDANIWDANGGIDRESIAYSIDFFTKMDSIPPGLTEANVADLAYLNQVLDKIGRR